jgi:fructose-specific PTS system IIA-like component
MAESATKSAELRLRCTLPGGLHARPASVVAELAGKFAAEITLRNLRTAAAANAKSVLSLIAAGVQHGDEFALSATGPQQEEALVGLRRCLEEDLPALEAAAPAAATVASAKLPLALASARVAALLGLPASAGVGSGAVVHLAGIELPPEFASRPAAGAAQEQRSLAAAWKAVRERLERSVEGAAGATSTAADILRAHLAILADVSLRERVEHEIERGASAVHAAARAGAWFAEQLRQARSVLVRERALDVEDVTRLLLEELCGVELQPRLDLRAPSIVVAEDISPQQFLALAPAHLRGLLLEAAGTTSHAVLLARSAEVPVVTGIRDARLLLAPGEQVLVDGGRGFVARCNQADEAVQRYEQRERATLAARQQRLARFAQQPAATADGRKLEVGANVSQPEELDAAFRRGADGIGVFRTELLFTRRAELPAEDEQFVVYAQAARAAGGRPVLLRTLDVGGDKPLPALDLPREPNPFLGERGVRLYPRFEAVLRTQLRAMLRASAAGRVWIMLPMVASPNEVRWVRERIMEIHDELRAAHIAHDAATPLGIMLEVPAAVLAIPELVAEADFFSFGTNDLAQYFFAADRSNAAVAPLANVRAPAFLRLLKQAADAARAAGKWIGMCGDMAADVANLPLLLGLGLDEISVPAALVAQLKERVQQLRVAECERVLNDALRCATVAEVERLLAETRSTVARPIIEQELISVTSDAQTQQEAIADLAGLLFASGRAEDRGAIEDAVWQREQVYATAMGFGVAIPHCRNDAVLADSVAVLRMQQPIRWGSEDVRLVILLAITGAAADKKHLQVFSQFARKLMDEKFRDQLLTAPHSGAVLNTLSEALQLN